MAHKKAGGSTSNVRDSNPKYRGVKRFGGQTVGEGDILVRQKGLQFHLGKNTYAGKDRTIHARVPGIVRFSQKRIARFNGRKIRRTVVSVEHIKT
jgi:large subunit ribosomal protein L27